MCFVNQIPVNLKNAWSDIIPWQNQSKQYTGEIFPGISSQLPLAGLNFITSRFPKTCYVAHPATVASKSRRENQHSFTAFLEFLEQHPAIIVFPAPGSSASRNRSLTCGRIRCRLLPTGGVEDEPTELTANEGHNQTLF